jgi:hypothetical protein
MCRWVESFGILKDETGIREKRHEIRGGVAAQARKDYPVYMMTLPKSASDSISPGMRRMQILPGPKDYVRAVHAKITSIGKQSKLT